MFWLFVACSGLLLLIWLGYPVIVALLASMRRNRPVAPVTSTSTVTVIIASVDAPNVIRERVRDVLNGDFPPGQLSVVVGVDHQAGIPAELEALDARVRFVVGDAPGGKAATLNAAVRAATGDILVMTDASQRFETSTISRLVATLSDPRMGAVSGALQIGADGESRGLAERYWRFEKWLRRNEARLHSAVGVTGAVYAMRRSSWTPLPGGLILDDVYVPMDLVLRGFRVGFEPSARAIDDRRFPPALEFRRKARTLTGVLQLCAWLPAILVPGRNPIWAQFVFHKLLRLATPYLLVGALVGFAAWVGQALVRQSPSAAVMTLAVVLTAVVALLASSHRVRQALWMAIALQAAVVRATVNGFRGEWDVWRR